MNAGLTPLWISIKTSLLATFITFFIGIGAAYLVANYKIGRASCRERV